MTDLVKRARGWADYIGHRADSESSATAFLCRDLADRIEQLEVSVSEREGEHNYYEDLLHERDTRIEQLEADIQALKHDIERYMAIANTEANRAEQLKAEIGRLKGDNKKRIGSIGEPYD